MYTFFLIFIWIICATFVYAGWRAAPWVPTRKLDVDRFLKLADIKTGQKFYDLGCGDARLVCAAGDNGAKSIGYEISLFPYILGTVRILLNKNKNSQIKFRDLWNINLTDADTIFVFLMPKVLEKLKNKVEKETKIGTKIISYTWPIPGWTPLKIDTLPGHATIYLYQR